MKIFQSKAYKVIIGYVYGWGATAVIVGALFKIMHFPGAGIVLTAGMLVEAFIFFMSAFEPAMEHYDWARVFPILAKKESELTAEDVPVMPTMAPAKNPEPVKQVVSGGVTNHVSIGLDNEDLNKLRTGFNKIAETADHFAGIMGNAPMVVEKMEKASASFEQLGVRTQEMSRALEDSVKEISSGCGEINRILVESAQSLTSQIKENCEKLSSEMGGSAANIGALSKLMDEQLQQVQAQATDYSRQMAGVNKNISALNALYELQINETKEYFESFRSMQGDMSEMLEQVSLSLDNAKLFKQESQQLANNVASLNSVYGNMLSVVNNN